MGNVGYYFSHPHPHVLVGSFNPSGDDPEDAEVIAEIGDQDRGHNLLVEIAAPALAEGLRRHVAAMSRPFVRLRNTPVLRGEQASAWFFPRLRPGIAEAGLRGADEILGCISHLKRGRLVERLVREAARGARVRLLLHDTERRVPGKTVAELARAGVSVSRFVHPQGLPMHAKFILADGTAWFGSFNYNPRSRWLNREVLLSSRHPAIVAPLRSRFEEIAAACAAQEASGGRGEG